MGTCQKFLLWLQREEKLIVRAEMCSILIYRLSYVFLCSLFMFFSMIHAILIIGMPDSA